MAAFNMKILVVLFLFVWHVQSRIIVDDLASTLQNEGLKYKEKLHNEVQEKIQSVLSNTPKNTRFNKLVRFFNNELKKAFSNKKSEVENTNKKEVENTNKIEHLRTVEVSKEGEMKKETIIPMVDIQKPMVDIQKPTKKDIIVDIPNPMKKNKVNKMKKKSNNGKTIWKKKSMLLCRMFKALNGKEDSSKFVRNIFKLAKRICKPFKGYKKQKKQVYFP